ncbi:MAG: hypothetical protein ACFFD1_04165 [Candidatus Thorarchaeota archaeon]
MKINSDIINQLKGEVDSATKIILSILQVEFTESLQLVYFKGSAAKSWDSLLDYIPRLSDVDIHIKLNDKKTLFDQTNKKTIKQAMRINTSYRRMFLNLHPKYLHIPRLQIMAINKFENNPNFIFPKKHQVKILYGKWNEYKDIEKEEIQKIDRNNLIKDYDSLKGLSEKLVDKSGLEFWNILKGLSWKISPSPTRLLTNLLPENDPYTIWSYNRTKTINILKRVGSKELSEKYKQYYILGWENFYSGFTNHELLNSQILIAYEILEKAIELV